MKLNYIQIVFGITMILVGMAIANEKEVRYEYKKSAFTKMTKQQVADRRMALAEMWDWQNPGRLHVGPPGYSPTNENAQAEFGAFVDVGYVTVSNKAGEVWLEYNVSEKQTGGRATEKKLEALKTKLGMSTNDVKFVKDGKPIKDAEAPVTVTR